MLGVHKKLMKYVDHSSKRKKLKKIYFLCTSYTNCNQLVFGLKEFMGSKMLCDERTSSYTLEL